MFWIIEDAAHSEQIEAAFEPIDYFMSPTVITEALRLCALQIPSKQELAQRFLVVIFPILSFTSWITTVSSTTSTAVRRRRGRRERDFEITPGQGLPESARQFGMYLNGAWHTLSAKEHTHHNLAAVDALDVAILQRYILEPLLGIKDPRRSNASNLLVVSVAWELENKVQNKDGSVAFAMHPTSMNELLDVADDDAIMPPKSTWFEPKLRSGLFLNPAQVGLRTMNHYLLLQCRLPDDPMRVHEQECVQRALGCGADQMFRQSQPALTNPPGSSCFSDYDRWLKRFHV